MKNLFSVFVFCWVACAANAQQLPWELPAKAGAWDYPVKPGMEEWRQLKTNNEKVRVLQIPEDVLSSLSTEDLTDLCLRSPLLLDFLRFENTNAGLDKLFNDFNGIRELYKRKDAARSLMRRYVEKIQLIPVIEDFDSELKKGSLVISVSALEGLLSRFDEERDSLKEILQALVAGYEEKVKYPAHFRGPGFQTNYYSRAQVIAKMEPSFVERLPLQEQNPILYSGRIVNRQTDKIINEWSYQIISNSSNE